MPVNTTTSRATTEKSKQRNVLKNSLIRMEAQKDNQVTGRKEIKEKQRSKRQRNKRQTGTKWQTQS